MKSSFWDLHWPLVLFEPRFPQLSQWTGLCSVLSLRGAPMPLDRVPGLVDTVAKPGTDPSSWALSLLLAPPCRAGPSRVLPIVLSLSSALDWCRAEWASGGSLSRLVWIGPEGSPKQHRARCCTPSTLQCGCMACTLPAAMWLGLSSAYSPCCFLPMKNKHTGQPGSKR